MKAYLKATSKKHTVPITYSFPIRILFFCTFLFFLPPCINAQANGEKSLAIQNSEEPTSISDTLSIPSPEFQKNKPEIIHIKGNTKIYIAENTTTTLSKINSEFIIIQKVEEPQVEKTSPKKEKRPQKIAQIKETKTEEKITKKSASNYLSFPFNESQSYGQGYFPGVASANPFSWTKKQNSAVDLVKHDFYPILINSSGIISYSREIKSVFSENQPYISRPPPARLS